MEPHNIKIAQIFAKDIPVKEFNRAIQYLENKKPEKAVIILKKMLKMHEFKELWVNLGVAYKALNDHPRVKECFEKACDPTMPLSDGSFKKLYPIGLSNLGLYYYAIQEDDIAIELHKLALTEDPLYYDAIWNLSLASLRKLCSNKEVDAKLAWEYYSWRFKRPKNIPLKNQKPDIKFWDFKTPYPDEEIVILIEQGMGDAMMFGRYLSYIKPYFKKMYVQCTPEMDYLFENVCRDPIETNAMFAVPMASLAKMLDYIPPGNWLASKYVEKERDSSLNIMCVWAGNKDHVNSINRDTHAGYFDKLPGIKHSVVPRKGYQHMPVKDWESTIKYLEQIDLVITIDSSMAHLCGSLGKPCIVLMPLWDTDFRWGDNSMGINNVWYKSVKVVRNENNWDKVFTEVRSLINAWPELYRE